MGEVLGRGRADRRFAFVLSTVFAGLALGLAVLGLYGVLSHSGSQRRREIGVRVALGARSGDVAVMVVRRGLVVTGVGLGVGLGAARALEGTMEGLVFQTGLGDPLLLAVTVALLGAASVAASFVPARRAMRTEVRQVLAEE
jgi:ABC-type antimicrobial peptide transport system permease subunit